MLRHVSQSLAGFLLLCLVALPAARLQGQGGADAGKLLDGQRQAMSRLAALDGKWKGEAWVLSPGGEKITLTQTERVGGFLDGTLKVIEGTGFGSDGVQRFHAMGIISYDPVNQRYSMRSYAQGRMGDYPVEVTDHGFAWEIEAGPATIRYEALIRNGTWREVGMRRIPGQEPVKFFEMKLDRVGDTDWPRAGAVKLDEQK